MWAQLLSRLQHNLSNLWAVYVHNWFLASQEEPESPESSREIYKIIESVSLLLSDSKFRGTAMKQEAMQYLSTHRKHIFSVEKNWPTADGVESLSSQHNLPLLQTEVQRYASSLHMSPKANFTRNKRGIKNLRGESKFLLRIGELCGLLMDVDYYTTVMDFMLPALFCFLWAKLALVKRGSGRRVYDC